ncbi:MAG: lipocalin family protein [Bacteroidetes bacterium]|nr:lipocalin family protein [Bacteroidota bacterium]
MKKYLFPTLILACIVGATLSSCSKSNSPSLTGTWKLSQLGTDLNNNGVIDSGEMISNNNTEFVTLTLNSNGTGAERVTVPGWVDTTYGISSWKLKSNLDLVITYGMGDIYYTHIAKLTENSLTLADTIRPIQWTVWTR